MANRKKIKSKRQKKVAVTRALRRGLPNTIKTRIRRPQTNPEFEYIRSLLDL